MAASFGCVAGALWNGNTWASASDKQGQRWDEKSFRGICKLILLLQLLLDHGIAYLGLVGRWVGRQMKWKEKRNVPIEETLLLLYNFFFSFSTTFALSIVLWLLAYSVIAHRDLHWLFHAKRNDLSKKSGEMKRWWWNVPRWWNAQRRRRRRWRCYRIWWDGLLNGRLSINSHNNNCKWEKEIEDLNFP